ncbi:MAG TPA: hypothetical protein VGI11_00800 [Variovorax sp.]
MPFQFHRHSRLRWIALALALGCASASAQAPVPDAASFRAVAALFGTDAGIEYRYGPAASAPQGPTPTYAKRPDQSYNPVSMQNGGDRGCSPDRWCGSWSIGGPLRMEDGPFSSSIINVAYVPDDKPAASFYPKRYFGVASLQQISVANNVMAVKPEPSWTTYDSPGFDGGANDANIERYAGTYQRGRTPWWPTGVALDRPVALGKCYGRLSWCTNSLVAYASGWIVAVGSNTSHDPLAVKLPDGMVPTGIAVTNSGEFALVAVMNTRTLTAQVAVIALAAGCQDCNPHDEASWYEDWGSHHRVYHGLPGLGNYIAGKYIGAVDLPDSLRLPTEISVSTGHDAYAYLHVANFWRTDVESPVNRTRFLDDPWLTQAIARTGMAVVISKHEKRAAFLDLRPLFEFYRRSYFAGTRAQFDALMDSRGDGDAQWPYTFRHDAGQKPRVIKVMDLPEAPTAVRMSLHAPHRAFIATQEGMLRVFDLGARYLDQEGAAVGQPGDIRPVFNVKVGRNPTSIAYVRGRGVAPGPRLFAPASTEQFLIVAARAERKIQWVKFDPNFNSASIFKTLQDSRLSDPIAVEDAEAFATESYVVSVADYAGRAVRNYLYGPIIFWPWGTDSGCPKPRGCALLGGAPFEYGGAYELPGRPFQMGGANIN